MNKQLVRINWVRFKNRFIPGMQVILEKLIVVSVSSFIILLCLGLFNFDLSLKNFFGSIALYFIIEELNLVNTIRRIGYRG